MIKAIKKSKITYCLLFLLINSLNSFSQEEHRDIYVFERNGKKGLVNNKMEIVVDPVYEQLGGFTISYYNKIHQDGLLDVWRLGDNYSIGDYIVFKLKGKYGVMSLDGQHLVKPLYDELRYTAVSGVFRYEENEKFGLVNKNGEEFLKANYDLVSPEDKENIIVKEADNYFLVDYKGKLISKKIKHRIFSYDKNTNSFIFQLDKKYGYKKSNGDLLFDTNFYSASSFNNGKAKVRKDANGKFGFINANGKIILPPTYESIYLSGDFDGYYIRNKDYKYGLLDKNIQLLLKPEYDEIGSFNNGFASVKKNDKYGFINKKGKLIIPLIYEDVSSFSEGLAPVKLNKKWGFINSNHKVVIDFKFEGSNIKPFSDGLAAYEQEYNNWGYINKKGELQIESIYKGIVTKFINGAAIVYLKGDKYLINKDSKKFLLKSKRDESQIEIMEVDSSQHK